VIFHEAFGRALARHGGDTVFGVLGDANLFLMDSFRRLGGGRYLSMANESGAVLAAAGYANATGRLGVATVTHGPAVTNTVTALVEGVRSRTPVLLIAGDTPAFDREALQGIAQAEVIAPTGAGFEQVYSPRTLAADLNRAARAALAQRRPVVLNVPVDFQWAEVDEPEAGLEAVPDLAALPQAVAADPEALDRAVGLIASAHRPLLLVGRGAGRPGTRTALLGFAERIGAPVATTLRAKDLFLGAPGNLGLFGTLASEFGLETIQRSDCVIAVGASLNRYTAVDGDLLRNKTVVRIDLDPQALARGYHVDAPVVGDAITVLAQIVEMLDEAEIAPSRFASAELAEAAAAARPTITGIESTPGTVNLRAAMARLDAALPLDRTLVLDAGRFLPSAFAGLRVPEPRAYIPTMNFGSIGLGTATAVGAAIGVPDRLTVLVCGDGGFMLGGLAEFNSAVRHGADLVVALFNDSAYGAEHIQFRARDLDPVMSIFDWPDFAPVATALGGQGYTVRSGADLDDALANIGRRDRPVLLDIKIDPDQVRGGFGH
jgi:acetolactate synthase I/II/III large subunit